MVEITHGISGSVCRQVVGLGDPAAGRLAGMDLHDLPARGDPDQGAIGAHVDLGADQVPGDRVERFGHLDVFTELPDGVKSTEGHGE
jgi:hypothetical protein